VTLGRPPGDLFAPSPSALAIGQPHLHTDADELKRRVLNTVAAFATGRGGTILFGVDNDGTSQVLTRRSETSTARFDNAIRNTIQPQPQ
jgi:predicted HTH transcriptional regulator